ncbi:uncharacterized protein METZ01_LOCUS488883 [marine metagenome]|uniref:Uncharacterized protein n=1 Tax=marine metagenome TaxID=408172 RepID=A0A383CVH6_9ZZZZ
MKDDSGSKGGSECRGHDWVWLGDNLMDENNFNMAIRKYLKKVGINSQREIEQAVNAAIDAAKLSGGEILHARMRLQIDEIDLDLTIEGEIGLA